MGNNKLTLKGNIVSEEDINKLAEILDARASWQGKYVQFGGAESGFCFFPEKVEDVSHIKEILDKYGVKSEVRPFTHNNGKHTKVVRIIFDDVYDTNHTSEYTRFVSGVINRMRVAKQKKFEKGKATTQSKMQKIFPFIRWFKKEVVK